jgi:hypothetical protein
MELLVHGAFRRRAARPGQRWVESEVAVDDDLAEKKQRRPSASS